MKKVIGLDIGASKITGLILEGRRARRAITIVTPKNLGEFKYSLFKLISFLLAPSPYPSPSQRLGEGRSGFPQKSRSDFWGAPRVGGIGVGMAGLVDPAAGVVKTSPNLKFVKNLALVQLLNGKFHLPVKIDNDANCFVRGEYKLGRAGKFKNVVGLTLGTGIGGGFVINGRIYRGSNHMGGEVGKMFLSGGKTWEALFQQARARDDFKTIGELTAKGLANLVNLLDPHCIVLAGGVALNQYKQFLPLALKQMKKYLLNPKAQVKVYLSRLDNAAAIGGALLFED